MEKETKAYLAVWCAIFLAIAIFPLPYGYYQLLRLFVTISAALIAYSEFQEDDKLNIWVICFIFAALLFNPIIPIYLKKEMWMLIDALCSLVFGIYGYRTFKKS